MKKKPSSEKVNLVAPQAQAHKPHEAQIQDQTNPPPNIKPNPVKSKAHDHVKLKLKLKPTHNPTLNPN